MGGMEVYIHAFLTWALDGGEWSASLPGRFNPGKRTSSIHCIEGLVRRRDGLDAMKRKICPGRESNPDSAAVYPEARRYTDWAIPALYYSLTPRSLAPLFLP
jgi:hypothetical protein